MTPMSALNGSRWHAAALFLAALPACAVPTTTNDAFGPDGLDAGVDRGFEDAPLDSEPDADPAAAGDASPDDSAAPSPTVRDAFSASCQNCAAGQRCAPGYGGEYCVAPCPGQPCPPSGPQVPYCDAYGGVHCMSS
jgi:hypothetical protein